MGKLTAKDIKNAQSLLNLVRTNEAYKLFKNSFVESRTGASDLNRTIKWTMALKNLMRKIKQ